MAILTQEEANELLEIPKEIRDRHEIIMPTPGGKLEIPLFSRKKREEFIVNYNSNSINVVKRNHHLRARKVIGLARLDLNGPNHTNPDGKVLGKIICIFIVKVLTLNGLLKFRVSFLII